MAHGELRGSVCPPGELRHCGDPAPWPEQGMRLPLPPSVNTARCPLAHRSHPAGTEREASPPARSLKNGVSWARPESCAFQNIPSRGHKAEDARLPECLGFSLAGKGRCSCASVGYRVPVDPDMDRILREGERNVHRNWVCACG